MPAPLVAVIMGSKSDWDTMSHAAAVLDDFGVPYLKQVVSAHRTPAWMAEFAEGAEGRGLKVIIAGRRRRRAPAGHGRRPHDAAGARRAGAERRAQRASIRCSRSCRCPGGVPVATLAIGKPGAKNAGLLAVRDSRQRRQPELARAASRPSARRRPRSVREDSCREPRSCFPAPRSACSAADSSGGCSRSRRGGWATACTRSRPTFDTPTGQVADVEIDADYDDLDAVRAFARGVDVVTFEFENVSTAAADDRRRDRAGAARAATSLHSTQHRAREKTFLRLKGFPVTPFESVRIARGAGHRRRTASACRRCSRPPTSATTARASTESPRRRPRRRCGGLVGHQTAVLERFVDFVLRGLGRRRPRPRRRVRPLRRDREHASQPHPRPVGLPRPTCRRPRWPRPSTITRGDHGASSTSSACCASSSS